MKRLGRFDVWIITTVPGNPDHEKQDFRTVYEDRDGNTFINWGRDKWQVYPRQLPGTYELRISYRPIQILTGADMMALLQGT